MIANLLFLSQALAAETAVPVPLQATLLTKVAAYDRSNSGDTGPILIVERDGDVASHRIASQLQQALEGAERPSSVARATFTSADAVAVQCAAAGAHIVYVATALSPEETTALAAALTGKNILTVSSDPTSVPEGVVLAFDLISGQTKILINLPQARAQGVDFDTALLSIAKVYK